MERTTDTDKKTEKLLLKRKQLLEKAATLKTEHRKLREGLQPEIDSKKQEADSLAVEFRRLYGKSQEAYSNDDRASAKALAVEGHAVQDRCESLNVQVKNMCDKIKEASDGITALCTEADELKAKVQKLSEKRKEQNEREEVKNKTTSSHFVSGFEDSNLITSAEINKFLGELPSKFLDKIQSVRYDEGIHWVGSSGKIKVAAKGITEWDEKGGAFIKIGKVSKSNNQALEVLSHEIGHVVYEHFVSDEQKAEWFTWHMQDIDRMKFVSNEALLNEIEDFAESFRLFKTSPGRLQKHDKRRYNFIKGLVEEIKNEKS